MSCVGDGAMHARIVDDAHKFSQLALVFSNTQASEQASMFSAWNTRPQRKAVDVTKPLILGVVGGSCSGKVSSLVLACMHVRLRACVCVMCCVLCVLCVLCGQERHSTRAAATHSLTLDVADGFVQRCEGATGWQVLGCRDLTKPVLPTRDCHQQPQRCWFRQLRPPR